jgi:acyl-coenzyme A synthetase/AMP-(fatty) acid ligase
MSRLKLTFSAYIVLNQSSNHAKLCPEVQAWVAARVAQHKRLRGGIVVLDAIPKSPSGKILRRDLRERAKKETAPVYGQVKSEARL